MGLKITRLPAMRGIGMSMLAKPGVSDFAGMWQNKLAPRMGEIQQQPGGTSFAICRCVPGATDGTFEYIALMQATPDAPVPAGMIAVDIPACDYATFPVTQYEQLAAAWENVPNEIGAQDEWTPYCGEDGCRCKEYPSFEYYDPAMNGKAAVYISVHRA